MIVRASYIIIGYFTHVLLGNFGQVVRPVPTFQLSKPVVLAKNEGCISEGVQRRVEQDLEETRLEN